MHNRFISDVRGNISVVFAIIILVVITAAGGAIDVSNAYSQRSRLQDISDTAALAASKGNDLEEMRDLGMYSVKAQTGNMDPDWKTTLIDIDPEKIGGQKNVKVTVGGEYRTAFLGIVGKKVFKVKASSEVSEAVGDIEISLVLDVSFSMSGAKIASLRTSAKNFIDVIMGENANSLNTSMNIVPFGGNVNIGAPLAARLMPGGTADWDPSDSDYRATTSSPDAKADALYRFTGGMNCIETKLEDYGTSKIADSSRSQIPRFLHQNSLLSICPEDESSILYNSGAKQALKDKIDDLVLSHGTGMDVGADWGLKTLSPSHRGIIGGDFSDRPTDFNGSNQKILVIMTDGNITGQGRPREPNNPSRLTDPSQMANNPHIVPGSWSSTSSTDDAVGRFKKVCEVAAQNNIMVFTIGFRIDRGGIADQLLDYCATDSSKYYFVETLDPSEAFDGIAQSVSQLRIVR